MLEYRSVADLNRLLVKNLDLFRHADLVVGVPRSGMLPAVLLALHLDVPVMDLDAYCQKRDPEGGKRLKHRQSLDAEHVARRRRVLVIDDSLARGSAMARAKQRIASSGAGADDIITYSAVYVIPAEEHQVDIWCEELPRRVFEWNILNHSLMPRSCVDIDGVLCRDPTEEENDDGPRYRQFLSTVAPLRVPSYEIGWLVTSRLEKYRDLTETWLESHGIRYQQLVMLGVPSKEARVAARAHAPFKAQVYRSTDSDLFIESDRDQARTIADLCCKPVYCVTTGEMMYHNKFANLVRRDRRHRRLKRVLRSLVPERLKPYARRGWRLLGFGE